MKKKLMSLLVAAAMVVGMTSTVFASSASPSANGVMAAVEAATDANGNAVSVTIQDTASAPLTEAEKKAVEEIKTTATLQAVLGAEYNANMTVADVKEVSAPEGTVFPIDITFKVNGVNASTKGSLLHFDGSAWEKIDTKFGNGTMTGTFKSLSPVAIVIDKTTATTAATSNGTTPSATSPKTSESNGAWAAAVVAVFAIGAAVTVRRKRA
ncbi:MAG: hypothetical protein EOM31_11420 [Bacteroidia bacterium]|nr:hypothetical protein [Lachnospiraceae bacterium]NCC11083.1 hypothetical protein [Bacteroidia bacterium]